MHASPCGRCRHGLPDFEVTHIVGPWSPSNKLSDALSGALNQVTCPLCAYVGTLEVPVLICAPHRNRIITIIGGNYIIPQLRAIEDLLESLLVARLASDTSLLKLPRQKATYMGALRGMLEVNDDVVWLDDRANRDREDRLRLPPRAKADKLITQLLEIIRVQVNQQLPDYDTLGEKYDGADINIALMFHPTQFEQTGAGKKAIRRAFSRIERKIRDHERHYLLKFLEMIEAAHGSYEIPGEQRTRRKRKRLRRISLNRIGKLPSITNVTFPLPDTELALRLNWLIALQHITSSNLPSIGLDYCESYIRNIDLMHPSFADIGALGVFGSLLYRQNSGHEDIARRYLNWSVALLPIERVKLHPLGTYLGAFIREYLGHLLLEQDNLDHALHYYREGVSLYQLASDDERAAELMQAIAAISEALREPQVIEQLMAKGGTSRPSAASAGLLQHVLETPSHEKPSGVAPHGRVRTAIVSFYRGEVGGGRFQWGTTLKPLNFDPRSPNSTPGVRWADMDVALPFTARSWFALKQDPQSVACENLIARIVEIRNDRAYLLHELLLKHPLLDWASASPGARERSARLATVRPVIWSWGASNKMIAWLASEWSRTRVEYGERADRWPAAQRVGMGLAFAQIATSTDNEFAERRDWFTARAIDLLRSALARGETRGSVFGRLSPQTRFDARRALARCYEAVGRLPEALGEFEENINAAFSMRHQVRDAARRAIIQEHAGADAGRLNRVRLRLHGFPPPKGVARDVFWTVELTRARALLDRMLKTDTPEPLVKLGEDVDASASQGTSLSATQLKQLGTPGPSYLQLSLLQSYHDFSGFWLAAQLTDDETVMLAKVDWAIPSDIYHRLNDLVVAIETPLSAAPPPTYSLVRHLLKLSCWLNDIIIPLFETDETGIRSAGVTRWISPAAYLVALPWAFCAIAIGRSKLPQLRHKPERVRLGTAFSGITLNIARMRRSTLNKSASIHVFIDPIGDLPEAQVALDSDVLFGSARTCPDQRLFCGLRASAARFLASVGEADVLCFLGHGHRPLDAETSHLIFSLGRRVGPEAISQSRMRSGDSARVAVLLACWGGRLTEFHESWEAEGLAYSLKVAGFDYVVSATWPISPRMAIEFLGKFLRLLRSDLSVDTAFFSAYEALVEQFGLYTVAVEAGSLRLSA